MSGANRSDVDTKYFYGTQQEWTDKKIECFEAAGVPATRGDPNDFPSLKVDASVVGMEVYREVSRKCSEEVGELYWAPATEESMSELYDWLVGQHDCLLEAGYTPETPPSKETFLDQWRTQGHAIYDPMAGVVQHDDWQPALAACPRTTETWPID